MTTPNEATPIDDGGPVFPQDQLGQVPGDGGWQYVPMQSGGMSLRDYFAAHATDGDVHNALVRMNMGSAPSMASLLIAAARYNHADAMLAARKAGQQA